MQKISLAINAVLLIAVGVLFYMVITLKKQVSGVFGGDSTTVAALPLPKAEGKIMYLNIDSLNAKYEYSLMIEAQLTRKGKANEAEIKNEIDKFQALYLKYQEQSQTGGMTQQQMEEAQRDLEQKEKQIAEKRDKIAQNYSDEVERLNKQSLKAILGYLKTKSKEHNYSYVMGYSEGANLLYVNDSLDITRQVISGLNAQYRADQEKKK